MKLGLLRNKFLEAIQNYQRVEQEGRIKVRQRAERQVRVGMTGFQVRASPCACKSSFSYNDLYIICAPTVQYPFKSQARYINSFEIFLLGKI